MSINGNEDESSPAEVSEHKPANNGDGMPSVVASPKPPQLPALNNSAIENPQKWYKGRKPALELLTFIVLITYTAFSGLQWSQIKKTNQLTREALNNSETQLELADRAWVKIADITVTHGNVFTVLDFEPSKVFPDAKPQAKLRFTVDYKNVGHSTAVNIKIIPELYLMGLAHYSDNEAAEAEENRFCNLPIKYDQAHMNGKPALFPDESSSSIQWIAADITEDKSYNDKDMGRVIMPILIVCMDYQYQSSPKHHQTRAVYDLSRMILPFMPEPHLFGIFPIKPDDMSPPDINLERVEADDYAD